MTKYIFNTIHVNANVLIQHISRFQVLFEITEGKLGVLEPPPTTLGTKEPSRPAVEVEEEPEGVEEDLTAMQSRLQALRS